jgi:hypothetical protein
MAAPISPSIAMTLFYDTHGTFFFVLKNIHHMGTQMMKGNETKGGETAMTLATMDGSRGFKRKGKRPKKKRKKKVPWVLWKGALAIGAGMAAAMAIVAMASAFS